MRLPRDPWTQVSLRIWLNTGALEKHFLLSWVPSAAVGQMNDWQGLTGWRCPRNKQPGVWRGPVTQSELDTKQFPNSPSILRHSCLSSLPSLLLSFLFSALLSFFLPSFRKPLNHTWRAARIEEQAQSHIHLRPRAACSFSPFPSIKPQSWLLSFPSLWTKVAFIVSISQSHGLLFHLPQVAQVNAHFPVVYGENWGWPLSWECAGWLRCLVLYECSPEGAETMLFSPCLCNLGLALPQTNFTSLWISVHPSENHGFGSRPLRISKCDTWQLRQEAKSSWHFHTSRQMLSLTPSAMGVPFDPLCVRQ